MAIRREVESGAGRLEEAGIDLDPLDREVAVRGVEGVVEPAHRPPAEADDEDPEPLPLPHLREEGSQWEQVVIGLGPGGPVDEEGLEGIETLVHPEDAPRTLADEL